LVAFEKLGMVYLDLTYNRYYFLCFGTKFVLLMLPCLMSVITDLQ